MDRASEILRYTWSQKLRIIMNGRKNQIVINTIADRSSFTPTDETFRITKLNMSCFIYM